MSARVGSCKGIKVVSIVKERSTQLYRGGEIRYRVLTQPFLTIVILEIFSGPIMIANLKFKFIQT